MSGETDLDTLTHGMRPVLDDTPYVFASVPSRFFSERQPACLGLFHEAEGVTLILSAPEAARLDLPAEPRWAHITLSVHSSLTAVGFMARVAGTLASAGISVNPVSGFYHDHLFVPWDARERALAALAALATPGTTPA